MLFTSPVFILIFLPLMLALYAMTPHQLRRNTICFFNVAFYILSNLKRPVCILFMFMCVAFTYCAAFAVRSVKRKGVVVFAVSVSVAILAALRILSMSATSDAIRYFPIGASFYLLATISCVIDVKRGDAPPPQTFTDTLLYISYFPVMIAGPVIRYKDFVRLTRPENINFGSTFIAGGVQLFVIGFIKRVAIAAFLDEVYSRITTQIGNGTGEALSLPVIIILSGLLLLSVYYSFSGYSDMGRGISMMLGIPLACDFGSCLYSTSVTEYMENFMNSLYCWFYDYIINPLKKILPHQKTAAAFASTAGFICMLFWYRASLPVLGAMIPVMILTWLDARYDVRRRLSRNILTRSFGRLITLAVMSVFWLLIRTQDVAALSEQIRSMTFIAPLQSYNLYLTLFNREFFLIAVLIFLVRYPVIHGSVARHFVMFKSEKYETTAQWVWSLLLMSVFVFSLMYLLPQYPSLASMPFLDILL